MSLALSALPCLTDQGTHALRAQQVEESLARHNVSAMHAPAVRDCARAVEDALVDLAGTRGAVVTPTSHLCTIVSHA
jgi:hypothetical protein